MAGDTMRFRNPAGHAGLLHNLLALVNGLAGFLESRIGLFAKESKTALVHVLVLLACLIGAAVLALFGYVFLIASVIAGIAHALHVSWIWITLGAAGLHFVLAVACLLIARSRMKQPMFKATALELKKDREWLKTLDKKSLSTN
ncbi:MAG TPA: phage holin family protein [Chthoniobacterales bacterium]|nr:phage holin family protein [Chthoniobacterales bacterium]